MDKPINIIIEETRAKLILDLNISGLPAYILEPVVKNICNELTVAKQKELIKAKEEYQKCLDNKETGGESNGKN